MFKLPPNPCQYFIVSLFILVIGIPRWIITLVTFSGAYLPFVHLLLWSVVANYLPTLKNWASLTVEFFIYLYLAQFIIYSVYMHCRCFLQTFLTMFWRPVVEMALSDLTTITPTQRNQRSNCQHPLDHWKSIKFQKNIYFCFIDYAKASDCVDHNKLWKTLQEMGIPDHLTCLLGNLYAGQEATFRTGQGTTDWFQIGKGVSQGCILSPCLFVEYIMWNVRLDEAQAGIKIAGRNINNLKYEDDTTLMAESEEELKSLLMRVREDNEKAGLKLNIQ